MDVFDAWATAWLNYARHIQSELAEVRWDNFLLWMLVLSLLCFAFEAMRPWRTQQSAWSRNGFWLDSFYLVFNFVLFPLLGFQAVWTLVEQSGVQMGSWWGLDLKQGCLPDAWPVWVRVVVLFVVRDFIQWNVHRLIHRLPALWRFHAIHHSASSLGFATHFRFHPMETVLYRTLEYLPLAILGFGVTDMTIVHVFALGIGHLNHTNIRLPLGWARFVLNNPQMHRWHHVRDLPQRHGVNFGLTLSVWDYLFGTAYVPYDAAQEELGVSGMQIPEGFGSQMLFPFRR